MSKTIEIIISPSGESLVETKGFVGGECRDASRFLQSTLGRTASEILTAEFHNAQVKQHNHLEREI
jgi:hypothetical protein